MIRIRRVKTFLLPLKTYEVELIPPGNPGGLRRLRTRSPNTLLTPIVGPMQAHEFIETANKRYLTGYQGWAVEFDDSVRHAT